MKINKADAATEAVNTSLETGPTVAKDDEPKGVDKAKSADKAHASMTKLLRD